MEKKLVLFLSLVISAVSPVIAHSAPDVEKDRSSAQIAKMLSIREELDLTDRQETQFAPIYNSYQQEQRLLNDRRIVLIKDFKAANKNLTDEQATDFIRRALDLEAARTSLKRKYAGLLLAKLPARIVARYLQLEQRIQNDIDTRVAEMLPLAK